MVQPIAVTDHQCHLGEGPVWDAPREVICWVDIVKGEIHEYSPAQRLFKTINLRQMVGCIAVTNKGDFIAGLKDGIGLVTRETGEVKIVANPESHRRENRFNDGKCDPQGRFWAGTVSLTEEPNAASLYTIEKGFSFSEKIAGVTISNGLAWSPDHRTFYYIDSPTREIVSYKFNENGEITDRKVVIKVDPTEGFPDGMTVDNEGMLWVAHWGGWQVSRWDPIKGVKLLSIPLPVSNVSSCTFGGNKLNDLYLTTAQKGLSDAELKRQPLAGFLFVLRDCGFAGLPAFEFQM